MKLTRAAVLAAACAATPAVHAQAASTEIVVVEFYHASLDHYFITALASELDALDSGRVAGWSRTGRSFGAWSAPHVAASPVCRYLIPPDKGGSHFFSAFELECASVAAKIGVDPAFFGYRLETANAFYIGLPNPATGACSAGTVPVYRLFNNRSDANHRYTTDRSIRDEMVRNGYQSEGFLPDGVVMCAPLTTVVPASDVSPFAAGCAPTTGVVYTNAEVEPYLAINPTNPSNLIGVWQQDRLSTGGARGNLTGVSFDGGRTWEKRQVPFSVCSGGNAGNGGNYQRATDPWVTFSPNGVAHQIALSVGGTALQPDSMSAINVSRSLDGGRTWSNPLALIIDGAAFFNDKEAIAADPTDARFVFASWDRLPSTGGGPSWFARTIDGGASWEPAREIYNPGPTAQTINNIPLVLPNNGTLLNFFSEIREVDGGNLVASMHLMRSTDKGVSWTGPTLINAQQAIGASDPETGTPVRDGSIIASIATSRAGQVALVWQDARFSSGVRDAIAFSRSLDGGATWSTPVRVNRDPSVQAFIPTVAFRDDGTIGVTYYDFRSNTADPTTLLTDYWLALSSDGVTWNETRVAGPFNYATASFVGGLFLGDYMSLVTRGDQFIPFFGITSGGTVNRSDIAIAFVAPPASTLARADASARDDPMIYRAESKSAMPLAPALASKLDATVREAMQRRVPGWRSPAKPTSR